MMPIDFGRAAVGAGKPASAIFKPDRLAADAALRAEQIFDLERNAGAFVARLAAHHRVIAAGEIVGIEHLREGSPAASAARSQPSTSAELALQEISSVSMIQ